MSLLKQKLVNKQDLANGNVKTYDNINAIIKQEKCRILWAPTPKHFYKLMDCLEKEY